MAFILERFEKYKTHYFITPYRDILKNYDIDKQILKKAKEELKKIGLIILDIEKIKEGRAIKNIKIKFKFEQKKKKSNKTSQSHELEKTDFTGLFGKIVKKIQK